MPQVLLPSAVTSGSRTSNPTRGREQAGRRPVFIVSVGAFNQSKAEQAVVIPLTSTPRGILWHVQITPPDGGVKLTSFIMCEALRSISKERLLKRWATVSPTVREEVEDRLRILLGL